MEIDPSQRISGDEYLIGRHHQIGYDVFITNDRIPIKQDTIDKNKFPVMLLGGGLGYFASKGASALLKATKNDVDLYKKYEEDFDYEISKEYIKRIEVGKTGRWNYFKIIDDENKEFVTFRYSGDILPLLKEFYPEVLDIKI